jgi:hypothetical protein
MRRAVGHVGGDTVITPRHSLRVYAQRVPWRENRLKASSHLPNSIAFARIVGRYVVLVEKSMNAPRM